MFEDGTVEQRPVIDLLLPIGTFAAGPVEPVLVDRAVSSAQHAFQGLDEDVVVFRRPVMRVVPVPGRDVHAELEAVFPAGVGQFLQHVPLPVPPGGLGDGVGADGAGPEAETVVVLGRDNNALETGGFRRGGPLAAVQVRRVEQVFGLRPVAPFAPGESVGSEMAEHIHLHRLPFQLVGRGNGAVGLFSAGNGCEQEGGGPKGINTHSGRLLRV